MGISNQEDEMAGWGRDTCRTGHLQSYIAASASEVGMYPDGIHSSPPPVSNAVGNSMELEQLYKLEEVSARDSAEVSPAELSSDVMDEKYSISGVDIGTWKFTSAQPEEQFRLSSLTYVICVRAECDKGETNTLCPWYARSRSDKHSTNGGPERM